jgi:hypothetical protein
VDDDDVPPNSAGVDVGFEDVSLVLDVLSTRVHSSVACWENLKAMNERNRTHIVMKHTHMCHNKMLKAEKFII